jgi:hypothetical protein
MTNLAVPVPAQETVGNLITAALWNANVYNGLTYLLNRPLFTGYQTTAQSVTNTAWTSLNIDTEDLDGYGGHSNTVNPSRYTPTVPGTYLLIGTVGFASNATGYRCARLCLNGSLIKGTGVQLPATTGIWGATTLGFVVCNGTTDYLELQGWQSSGAALNTNPNAESSPAFRALWISN